MPNIIVRNILAGFVINLLLCAVVFTGSGAAAALPTTGITVSPAFLIAQVGSKQAQTSVTVGVRNNFDVPVTITGSLNGFDVHNNALIPNSHSDPALADSVDIAPTDVIIEPNSSKNVIVTIHDTPNLSPGGHYISLLLTQSADSSVSLSPQLSIKPAVSVTIYLIKEDGAIRSLRVSKLQANRGLFSLPKTASFTFYNNGNVVSVPRGVVIVRPSHDNRIYAQGIVNQASIPIFPKSATTLLAHLSTLQHQAFLPKKYVMALQYRPDGQDTVSSVSTTFWYIPKLAIVTSILAVLLVMSLLKLSSRRIIVDCLKKLRALVVRGPKSSAITKNIPVNFDDASTGSGTPVLVRKGNPKHKD